MRVLLACLAVVAAIALPGVIVAATSGSPSTGAFHPTSGSTATGWTGYAPSNGVVLAPPAVDPTLRPAVDAVKRAYAARGVELVIAPLGPGAADAVRVSTTGPCPTVIQFRKRGVAGLAASDLLIDGSCSQGSLQLQTVSIVYSPSSAGPTIEAAVAALR